MDEYHSCENHCTPPVDRPHVIRVPASIAIYSGSYRSPRTARRRKPIQIASVLRLLSLSSLSLHQHAPDNDPALHYFRTSLCRGDCAANGGASEAPYRCLSRSGCGREWLCLWYEYSPSKSTAFSLHRLPPLQHHQRPRPCTKSSQLAIGRTPLIKLKRLSAETKCTVLGKAEFQNPGGSVKDRAALYVVLDAEERGLISPPNPSTPVAERGTVIEGTAGNTGIGLAHVCRSRGYNLIIYMPNTQSQGKIDLLRLLGADVRPVPAVPYDDPQNYNHQAMRCAEELRNAGKPAVWTNQFDNTANRRAHIETTGPEIWAQTNGQLDAFVAATGTGGTLAGVTHYLKEKSRGRVGCYLADPPGSVLHSYIQSGGKLAERKGGSITEGIGQGRVTENMKDEIGKLDGSVHIPDADSIAMVYRCLDEEGLYLGASSALNVAAAKKTAELVGEGKTVVTILCDGAYRYADRLFSKKWLKEKNLWEAIPEHLRRYAVLD